MYFEGNTPQGIGEASIAMTCIIYVLDEYLQNENGEVALSATFYHFSTIHKKTSTFSNSKIFDYRWIDTYTFIFIDKS